MTPLSVFCLYVADNKQFLGIRYSEWCVSAPTLEASIAATAMAQDELGHTRILHGILGDLPDNPLASRDPEDPTAYEVLPRLSRPFPSWEALVASALIVDGFLTHLMHLGNCSAHDLFRTRMKKAYEEERFHRLYAEGWAKWLMDRPEAAPKFREALSQTFRDLSAHWELTVLPKIVRAGDPEIPGLATAIADFRDSLTSAFPIWAVTPSAPPPFLRPDEATMRLISGYYRKVYGVG